MVGLLAAVDKSARGTFRPVEARDRCRLPPWLLNVRKTRRTKRAADLQPTTLLLFVGYKDMTASPARFDIRDRRSSIMPTSGEGVWTVARRRPMR